MLTLLDVLRPLYDKQPAHVHAPQAAGSTARLSYVAQTGRARRSDALCASSSRPTTRATTRCSSEYAHALANAGDYPGAYAWLTARPRQGSEVARLRRGIAAHHLRRALLRQQGRYAELADFLAAWVEQNPSSPHRLRTVPERPHQVGSDREGRRARPALAEGRQVPANCRRPSEARSKPRSS